MCPHPYAHTPHPHPHPSQGDKATHTAHPYAPNNGQQKQQGLHQLDVTLIGWFCFYPKKHARHAPAPCLPSAARARPPKPNLLLKLQSQAGTIYKYIPSVCFCACAHHSNSSAGHSEGIKNVNWKLGKFLLLNLFEEGAFLKSS